MLPSAWGEGVGIAMMGDFGADLRGLLPRCVRFAPTSHPVNGNTRYWPVCLTLARRDLHPLDCNRRFPLFIGSSSSKLFRTRHPEPLTDPDMKLSPHPARATPRKPCRASPRQEFLRFPVDSILTWVTCPLRSTGITPLPHYYEAVRP
jgi:hypothetical protein